MPKTARMETSRARIAYVSTIAGRMIALPSWSGRFAIRPMHETAAFAWRMADHRPTNAIGRQASRYSMPFVVETSTLPPPMTPICESVRNAIRKP